MSAPRFDLADLRLFLLVHEHGSLTRGAQAAHLALASASERISGMEAALGTRLFERTRRGVRTTAAGAALARHARAILEQVEQMRGELRAYATGLKGRIRLMANTSALSSFLPAQIQRFLSAHPDLSIDLDERPSTEIVRALADHRTDLGIAVDTAELGALQSRLLAHDSLEVAAASTHWIAGREHVALAQIADEPFVGLSDAALEKHLAGHAELLGRPLHYRVRLRSAPDLGALIAAGVGIAILPQGCLSQLRHLPLAVRPLTDSWAIRRLYLCARDFAALPPPALAFARQCAGDDL